MANTSAGPGNRKIVIFDLMDTLLVDPVHRTFRTLFGSAASGEPAALSLYRTYRDRAAFELFESGRLTEYEYFRAFYHDHTPPPILQSLPRPQKVKKILLREVSLMPGALSLLEELQARRIPVAVASNYSIWYHDILRFCPQMEELCDYLFFSCELGYRKPDPVFYSRIGQTLKTKGLEEIFFLDDRQVNIDAATRAGWQAMRFTSMTGSRQKINAFLDEESDFV